MKNIERVLQQTNEDFFLIIFSIFLSIYILYLIIFNLKVEIFTYLQTYDTFHKIFPILGSINRCISN